MVLENTIKSFIKIAKPIDQQKLLQNHQSTITKLIFYTMNTLKKILLLSLTAFSALTVLAQNNPKGLDIEWQTDTSKREIPLSELTILLVPDGIPPIDKPTYWSVGKAKDFYFDHEPAVVLEINGKAKAFPLSVLNYHEIVNDHIGDTNFSVTFCPLCHSGLIFNRDLTHSGKKYRLDFGPSGILRTSNLVMWDRQTESWWQQITGKALVGELAGAELGYIPSLLISLEEFYQAYPEGVVLSNKTGHERNYTQNPYVGYDNPDKKQPRLFKGEVDSRLPAMERIIDIKVNGKYKVYPLPVIQEKEVINDEFQKQKVVVFCSSKTVSVLDKKEIEKSRKVGSVTVFDPEVDGKQLVFSRKNDYFTDSQTGSKWNIAGHCISGPLKGTQLSIIPHDYHFAFAWFAFHPESQLYSSD